MLRNLIGALLGTILMASGCAKPQPVTPSDIEVSKGPDGEVIYLPKLDTAEASGLAQYLQLQADLKGISRDGYFLNTQAANLHQQATLLSRARELGWNWQDLDGKHIDLTARLESVQARIKTLDVNG
tara:strand:- start:707 stop:1087 length:381 start_codon:yes stop_codon:yes gene_type:complete